MTGPVGSPTPGRSILILAGGRSRRLGHDKAWVEVGGRPVIGRLLDAARTAGVGDRIVAVRDPSGFEQRLRDSGQAEPGGGVRVIADASPDRGPVAGLASGLHAARGDVVAVLAGDLPFVSARLILGLLAAIESDPEADVVLPTVGGRDQPLCAAYRRSTALAAADAALASPAAESGPAVAAVLDRLRVHRITALGPKGPAALAILTRGVDTPEDLAWARERAPREFD